MISTFALIQEPCLLIVCTEFLNLLRKQLNNLFEFSLIIDLSHFVFKLLLNVIWGYMEQVYWPLDASWYCGHLTGYNSETRRHLVILFYFTY